MFPAPDRGGGGHPAGGRGVFLVHAILSAIGSPNANTNSARTSRACSARNRRSFFAISPARRRHTPAERAGRHGVLCRIGYPIYGVCYAPAGLLLEKLFNSVDCPTVIFPVKEAIVFRIIAKSIQGWLMIVCLTHVQCIVRQRCKNPSREPPGHTCS